VSGEAKKPEQPSDPVVAGLVEKFRAAVLPIWVFRCDATEEQKRQLTKALRELWAGLR
jgi:hypothetical protein